MKTFLFIFLYAVCFNAFAVPAGTKAENGNFKISEKSLAHMGISFQQLNGSGPWSVPKESLVRIKLSQGVYRRYDGEFTFVIVKVSDSKNGNVLIQSDDLESGDEVAVTGTKYLRMAETDLNSETVDNCAH